METYSDDEMGAWELLEKDPTIAAQARADSVAPEDIIMLLKHQGYNPVNLLSAFQKKYAEQK